MEKVMQEFVEKLIERMEESRKYNEKMLSDSNDCFSRIIYESQMNTYENSIRIVNQLAEEYNPSKSSGLDKLSKEPKTRIENIRSMSVEELADEILDRGEISTAIDFCQNFCGECENIPESECRKCLIKYLSSPVEQKKAIPTNYYKERFNRVQ